MNILIVSQPFGYGPTSEIINVINILRERLGSHSFFYFNNHAVSNLVEKKYVLDNHIDEEIFSFNDKSNFLKKFDFIISSYDPYSVFLGWWDDIPTVFYNGMTSFFEMNIKDDQALEGFKTHMELLKKNKDFLGFKKLLYKQAMENFHLLMILAMQFSKYNFVRNSPNLLINDNYPKNTEIVSAIVPTHIKKPIWMNNEEFIYISMSGSLAPIISETLNLEYINNAIKFFVNKIKIHEKGYKIILSCNKKIIDSIKKSNLPSNFTIISSIQPEENCWLFKNAKIVIASPGFTTVHETAYFCTPLLFLPEQNGSQPVAFHLLSLNGYPTSPNLSVLGETELAKEFKEEYLEEIYLESLLLFNGELKYETKINLFNKEIDSLLSNSFNRQKRTALQYESVEKMFGGYNGVEEIINKLEIIIK